MYVNEERQKILIVDDSPENLKKSEQKYREIFNGISEAILIFDTETMTLLDVNQTMLEMSGCSYEDIMNVQASCLLSVGRFPFTMSTLVDKFAQATAHDSQVFDWLICLKNGEQLWVEISLKHSYLAGQSIIILVARDISERKQAEKVRSKLEKQLLHAQKMEAIGTFAWGIAHDFNNILTPLIGFAEMVLLNIPKESLDYERQLAVIRASDRATELIKQISTISCQSSVTLQSLKIQPIIGEVLKFIRSSIPATIEVKTKIETDDEEVLANSTLIHQIVMNFCINACHAMEEKGGILEVRLSSVDVEKGDFSAKLHWEPRRYLKLEVIDTGHGMSAEVQERIFDPYFTTKNKSKGTGLGLSVVHGIVQSLNGYITVFSKPNEGTTFCLLLPASGVSSNNEKLKALGIQGYIKKPIIREK